MPPAGDAGAGPRDAGPVRPEEGAVVTLRQLPHELLGDPEFLRRFRAEAQIVAHLDPTYVVRTRAHMEDPFGLALISDYVEGAALRLMLPAVTAGNVEAALVVARDVLLGLETAHREGILHRDLQPAKIVVDRHGISRVADLGLVARTPSRRWLPGTPEYLAPELWAGEPSSIASDLYAAGCVLVECLTGTPPYEGGLAQLRDLHAAGAPPVQDLPPEVARMVSIAMARRPEERHARAWDFAQDVEEVGRALAGTGWERRGRRHLAAHVALALFPRGGDDEPPRGLIGRARALRRTRG